MKKLLLTVLKTVLFFVGWAVLAGLLPLPNENHPVIWRFWAELVPFFVVVLFTALFWLIEKRKIHLHIISGSAGNIVIGVTAGIIWIGTVTGIMTLCGVMRIGDATTIPMLWLWLISVFLNTIMQELLVRGYLYQMIKTNYHSLPAAIVTTALFTFMHGGAFEAGVLPVMNVITMSILMTVVMECTQSLTASIMMHFLWNGIGAVILGGVSLADDYPHLFSSTVTGNGLLSGGICKMEGSIVTLGVNIALIVGFIFMMKKKKSQV